ncbi:MAG: DUF167 domain-containing protein [Bryobacterales bacterium]|nr:DUF167 domain-containing protein [Bryobacterales bacterium]
MRVDIKVKPNAKSTRVEPLEGGVLLVSVTAPPVDGKANEAVIRAVAEYYGTPVRNVRICRGASGRKKTLEIVEPQGPSKG